MTYDEYIAHVRTNNIVHRPGDQFTPCGIRFWVAMAGTFHTDECLRGEKMCIGIHITAVASSGNPDLINCLGCLAAP